MLERVLWVQHLPRRCLGRKASSKKKTCTTTTSNELNVVSACSYHLRYQYMSPITTLSKLLQPWSTLHCGVVPIFADASSTSPSRAQQQSLPHLPQRCMQLDGFHRISPLSAFGPPLAPPSSPTGTAEAHLLHARTRHQPLLLILWTSCANKVRVQIQPDMTSANRNPETLHGCCHHAPNQLQLMASCTLLRAATRPTAGVANKQGISFSGAHIVLDL